MGVRVCEKGGCACLFENKIERGTRRENVALSDTTNESAVWVLFELRLISFGERSSSV